MTELSGGEGGGFSGVGVEEPAELGGFEGGGAVVGGAVFEGVEPALDFRQAADDDDGEAAEAGQRGLEDGRGRGAEDNVGEIEFVFAVYLGGVAVAGGQDLFEGGSESGFHTEKECLSGGS